MSRQRPQDKSPNSRLAINKTFRASHIFSKVVSEKTAVHAVNVSDLCS